MYISQIISFFLFIHTPSFYAHIGERETEWEERRGWQAQAIGAACDA